MLVGGTALATAIPILTSPILTRLYSPENFGVLAIFAAVVAALSPAVCGKYEIAMVLPRSDTKSQELFGLALWCATIFSVVFLVAVIIFSKPILSLLKAPNLNGWLYLSPLFLFLTGVMNAMTYFANRRQDYFTMARSKMVRSCSVAVVGITLGVAGFGAAGLLSGVLLGTLAGVGYLLYRYRMQMSGSVIRWSRSKKELLEKYKDYPRYNATSGLLNGLTSSMPIFFLTNYFSGDVVGFFALVVRVTEAPLTLISPSVSQVNLKTIVDYKNNNQWEQLYTHLLKTIMTLLAIVCLPVVLLWIYSPEIFALLFGKDWKAAGAYMQILIPAFVVRFLVSSISSTYGALNKNIFAFAKRIFSFALGVYIFLFVGRSVTHPNHFMMLIAAHIILSEMVGLVLIVWAVKNAKNQITTAG